MNPPRDWLGIGGVYMTPSAFLCYLAILIICSHLFLLQRRYCEKDIGMDPGD